MFCFCWLQFLHFVSGRNQFLFFVGELQINFPIIILCLVDERKYLILSSAFRILNATMHLLVYSVQNIYHKKFCHQTYFSHIFNKLFISRLFIFLMAPSPTPTNGASLINYLHGTQQIKDIN